MSILNEDLSKVKIVPACAVDTVPFHNKHGVFFDGWSFHNHLEQSYRFVDIMTFGASKDCCRVPVRRAIVGLAKGRTGCQFHRAPEQMKCYNNVHSKIVLGYVHDGTITQPDVYVGSLNFVAPTLYELMLRVTSFEQRWEIIRYYEAFWQTKPKHEIIKRT